MPSLKQALEAVVKSTATVVNKGGTAAPSQNVGSGRSPQR